MNSTLTKVFIFVGGVAVGAAASWKLLKTHFEQIAQNEIDSVKEYYSTRFNKPADEEEVGEDKTENITTEEPEEDEERNHRDYAAILAKQNYTNYAGASHGVTTVQEPVPNEGPYVIAPTEFGTRDDYDSVSLTYYADGVLADDADEPIIDINDVVGLESLDSFGDYEEDCVHVRNDELKTDFEILADSRRYTDVTGRSATGV